MAAGKAVFAVMAFWVGASGMGRVLIVEAHDLGGHLEPPQKGGSMLGSSQLGHHNDDDRGRRYCHVLMMGHGVEMKAGSRILSDSKSRGVCVHAETADGKYSYPEYLEIELPAESSYRHVRGFV